jgi:hypothetical protein
MGTEATEIAEACLSHLGREERALQTTLETLAVVRTAALAGDVPGLEALRGRQDEIARQTTALRCERENLRTRIATLLRIPATEATLAGLSTRVGGPLSDSLLSAGTRLRHLASEVDRINSSNAAVLGYCLGFARRVLRDLTGGGTPAESYGPDGTVTDSPCGSLLSARG